MVKRLVVAAALFAIAMFQAPVADAAGIASSIKFPCKVAGVAQLDPIVVPDGGPSSHIHEFAGNLGIPKGVHTYDEATQQGTTCSQVGDTAGYWVAPMIDPSGKVTLAKITVYYDCMVKPCTPFPPDFRQIFGYQRGLFSSKPRSYYGWNCANTQPLQPDFTNVDCRGLSGGQSYVTLRTFSPFCAKTNPDGSIMTDSPDHMSHVVYPPNYPASNQCAAGTVEVPRLRVNFNFLTPYCPDCDITSDMGFGTAHGASAHTDFWNTWNQASLEALVAKLNA